MALDYHKREQDTNDLSATLKDILPTHALDFLQTNFEHLASLRESGMGGFVANMPHDDQLTVAIIKAIDMDLNDELICNIQKIQAQLVFTPNPDWTGRDCNDIPYLMDSDIEVVYDGQYIQPNIASTEGSDDVVQCIWLCDILAACITQDTASPNVSFTIYSHDDAENSESDCASDCCDCADSAT